MIFESKKGCEKIEILWIESIKNIAAKIQGGRMIQQLLK